MTKALLDEPAARAGLFAALKHGDQDHQDWLREGIDAYFDGKPIPPPRGSGNKEKRIAELETLVEALRSSAPQEPETRPLDMCAHGADRGSYCGYCGGYSKGAQA